MNKALYFSKAVMGGGKTVSAIYDICYANGNTVLYAVPTKELANQIQESITNSGSVGFPDGQHAEDSGNTEEYFKNWNRKEESLKRDADIDVFTEKKYRVFTGDTETEVLTSLIKQLKEHYRVGDVIVEPRILIVTHQTLFNLAASSDAYLLENWDVIIDEDPKPFRVHIVDDSNLEVAPLNQLADMLANDSNTKLPQYTLTENQKEVLAKKSAAKQSSPLKANAENLLKYLASNPNGYNFLKVSDKKNLWMSVEELPLDKVIQTASEVHVLASNLGLLTKLYLQNKGIKVLKSSMDAEHETYPDNLQKRINIYRIWDACNHSLELLRNDKDGAIKPAIKEIVGDKPFISRTNEQYSKYFDDFENHGKRLPKITNGMNSYTDYSVIVDIAVYNVAPHVYPFFEEASKILGWDENTISDGYLEQEMLEPCAQAVCRIGLRNINNPKHSEYTIVVPDKRCEDYLKGNYFPKASYKRFLINDPVVEAGRKKGGVNQDTFDRVKRVKSLIENGKTVSAAIDEVEMSKSTYHKYKSLV